MRITPEEASKMAAMTAHMQKKCHEIEAAGCVCALTRWDACGPICDVHGDAQVLMGLIERFAQMIAEAESVELMEDFDGEPVLIPYYHKEGAD